MVLAIAAARLSGPHDVPVGAVVLGPGGEVLGRGGNRREADGDPTAHAEIIAIREAVRRHGDGWRLTGCTLAVTLEPCAMCAGALVGARVANLYFGAWEPKTGAVGSVWDVVRDPRVLHRVSVRGGIRELECAQMLTDFFARHR